MPEANKNCQYFLLQYAPSVLREALVPIGLFLFEDSSRLVQYAITRDWRTVRRLDPQADLRLLEALPELFQQLVAECARGTQGSEHLPPEKSLYEQLNRMQEDCAGSLRLSLPRGVVTADPPAEFQRLFEQYVARSQPLLERRPWREGGRPWIRARLVEALERHALWDRMQKDVSVAEFTVPGDGFRMDFAYRPNGITKYLHAISLERDWSQAKLLSYTFGRIRQKSEARLTAIVADTDPTLAAVVGCRQILADGDIAVVPLSQLEPFLATIRQELQLP